MMNEEELLGSSPSNNEYNLQMLFSSSSQPQQTIPENTPMKQSSVGPPQPSTSSTGVSPTTSLPQRRVRLPRFEAANVEYWLDQAEFRCQLAGIVDDATKYYLVASKLPSLVAMMVSELMRFEYSDGLYRTFLVFFLAPTKKMMNEDELLGSSPNNESNLQLLFSPSSSGLFMIVIIYVHFHLSSFFAFFVIILFFGEFETNV